MSPKCHRTVEEAVVDPTGLGKVKSLTNLAIVKIEEHRNEKVVSFTVGVNIFSTTGLGIYKTCHLSHLYFTTSFKK